MCGLGFQYFLNIEMWNYSGKFLNILNYTTVPILIGWGILGTIYVFFVHPLIIKIVKFFPKHIMKRLPDENSGVIVGKFENHRAWIASIYIVFNSVIAYMTGSGCFRINTPAGERDGFTMAFVTLSLGLLLQAILLRSERPLAAAGIFRNFKMLLGTVVTAVGVALTVSFPWSAKLCGFSPLRLREWCAVGVLLVIQFAVWEYAKFYVAVKSRRYYQ